MKEKIVHIVCPLGGDHTFCILKVHIEKGRISKLESTDLPQCSDDRCVCARGLSSHRLVYHPDRLKYPLKRLGPRGGGKWQRISWDEALDTIANKLLDIKAKYGTQAVHVMSSGSSNVGLLGRLMGDRFANAWGASVFEAKGWFADGGVPAASLMVLGDSGQGHDCRDYASSKILLLWGWNPAETSLREMKDVLNARDKGVKLVVIGPLFNATVAKADQWIPVRLGTDTALALGMVNMIIQKGLYDRDYILGYTVGPFLVREDNKMLLREGEVGGDSNKFLVFDQKAGVAVVFDSPNITPALFGECIVEGIHCKPAFQLLADRASEYPPERVSAITGVPAETVSNLAIEYATAKPAAIRMCHGQARTYHASMAGRAIITLGAITGNIGIRGGGVSTPLQSNTMPVATDKPYIEDDGTYVPPEYAYTVGLNINAVMHPPGTPGVKKMPGTTNGFKGWMAIRDGEPYPIKALIMRFRNLVHGYGNHRSYLDIFSKMDLVVVSDIFMSWTARYADIVLPETTVFEQSDLQLSRYHLVWTQGAIEPLYEARPAFKIWSDLAHKVGLGDYFEQTEEDIISTLLDSRHPSVADITLDKLESEGVIRANVPHIPCISFEDKKFPTPSGKIEFYLERLTEFGEELPSHKENLESPRTSALAKRYPLSLFTVKRKTRTQSIMACDWILELEPEPLLDINPIDAANRGIQGGDIVEVFNDRGKVRLKANLTEVMPPGAVNIGLGWLPEQFIDGHYNDLLFPVDDPQQINPALDVEPVVSDSRGAMHTLQYDCLVEVRSVQGERNG